MGRSKAERLYEKGAGKDEMLALLADNGVQVSSIGWDHYDNSLELHGVPADYRPTPEILAKLFAWGFSTVYVNHTDKWETHYNSPDDEGWRVSYPHKRGDRGKIMVEKIVPSWPAKWFDTGYIKIIPRRS